MRRDRQGWHLAVGAALVGLTVTAASATVFGWGDGTYNQTSIPDDFIGAQAVAAGYASKAGLRVQVTPHTFRRSCTTEMLRAGANMYHVKEMLGHESLDTLKHYALLAIQDLKKTHRRCHPRERRGE